MSDERFLLITANISCVFRESRDSKKNRSQRSGGRKFLMLE